MTTASPTPLASSLFENSRTSRAAPSRSFPRSQSTRPVQRRQSPLSALGSSHGFSAAAPDFQRISIGDSSDDEIPKPMNFSALTKAILEEKQTSKPAATSAEPYNNRAIYETAKALEGVTRNRTETPSRGTLRISRRSSRSPEEVAQEQSPRIVHLSGLRNSSALRRAASISEANPSKSGERQNARQELITPAPATRDSRASKSSAASGISTGVSSTRTRSRRDMDFQDVDEEHGAVVQDSQLDEVQNGQDGSGIDKVKSSGDGVPNSMRVKRVPMGSGTFLRSAPMRRPLRRRQSDDDNSPVDETNGGTHQDDANLRDENGQNHHQRGYDQAVHEPVVVQDFAKNHSSGKDRSVLSSSERYSALGSRNRQQNIQNSSEPKKINTDPATHAPRDDPAKEKSEKRQVEFKISAPPPALPSLHDQENEPPPTFKRNKSQVVSILGEDKGLRGQAENEKMLADSRTAVSPQRQPLAARSVNTPQRAAPPPPKMSVLATATTDGGASTVKSKTKPRHMTVNGKAYPLRGKLGRGGSSVVYRVMAENDRMFALKRVNLEDANEDTVRGYKGEIDLLKKLEGVDRVVRLLDWEVNDQKQTLSVLMEMGESDLNRILSANLHPEDAKLDLSFTRHYWREMLCCVAAVHEHDIVHSDLKPANFLLVQGRLKLIDFGIANAIDVENTVNVHRETNVGTPNYMSPESLQDTNADRGPTTSGPVTKLMKLGKPSDVWSLGCILYQMTYGKPPFAHIANQWNRIMAIINPAVVISYPATGVGGVTVPSSLRRLLQSCLHRDASQRPTIVEMLDDREAFLHPDLQTEKWEAEGAVPITEYHLEQILQNIVRRCRDPNKGIPTDVEMRAYPKGFMDQLRSLQGV